MFHETPSNGDVALINPGDLSSNELKILTEGLIDKKLRVVILGDKIQNLKELSFSRILAQGN